MSDNFSGLHDSPSQDKKQVKDSLDILKEYYRCFNIPDPRRFDMIPEILDYLTYISSFVNKETGEMIYERKRLTPIEKEVYRAIKRSVGDNACWKTTQTIADEVNCSFGAVSNAKKILTGSFEQLEGNPLIFIEERYINTVKEDSIINKRPNHLITLYNIWPYNNGFMSIVNDINYKMKYRTGKLSIKEAELAIENMGQLQNVHKLGAESPENRAPNAQSPNDYVPRGPKSPGDVNHIPSNHIPMTESYSPPYVGSNDPNGDDVYEMMKKFGIFEKEQKRLIERYGYNKIQEKIHDLKIYMKRRTVRNPGRYLVKMVEEMYSSSKI